MTGAGRRRDLPTKLRSVTTLSYYLGILVFYRTPEYILFNSTAPFTILFFVIVVGGSNYIPYGLIGASISILVGAGLFLGTDATQNRLIYKFQDFCVASPLSPVEYMLGLSLSDLFFNALSLAVIFCFFGFFHLINWGFPLAVGISLLGWVFSSALGFFLSTHILRQRSSFSVTALLTTLLTVLPPVFYPVRVIPQSFRFLAYIAPTVDVSVLMQSALGLQSYSESQLLVCWCILIGSTLFFLGLAGSRARWQQR